MREGERREQEKVNIWWKEGNDKEGKEKREKRKIKIEKRIKKRGRN